MTRRVDLQLLKRPQAEPVSKAVKLLPGWAEMQAAEEGWRAPLQGLPGEAQSWR